MLGFIKGDNTSELIVTVGSSTDGKAKVWNAQTGQEILTRDILVESKKRFIIRMDSEL